MDLPCCSMPRILIETPASGFARHATITISSVMIIIHYPELLASWRPLNLTCWKKLSVRYYGQGVRKGSCKFIASCEMKVRHGSKSIRRDISILLYMVAPYSQGHGVSGLPHPLSRQRQNMRKRIQCCFSEQRPTDLPDHTFYITT